jgi:hypothetical protein
MVHSSHTTVTYVLAVTEQPGPLLLHASCCPNLPQTSTTQSDMTSKHAERLAICTCAQRTAVWVREAAWGLQALPLLIFRAALSAAVQRHK